MMTALWNLLLYMLPQALNGVCMSSSYRIFIVFTVVNSLMSIPSIYYLINLVVGSPAI